VSLGRFILESVEARHKTRTVAPSPRGLHYAAGMIYYITVSPMLASLPAAKAA